MFNAEKKIANTLALIAFYTFCRSKTDLNFLAKKIGGKQGAELSDDRN